MKKYKLRPFFVYMFLYVLIYYSIFTLFSFPSGQILSEYKFDDVN